MNDKPFYLTEDHLAAIDRAADVLRAYAHKKKYKLTSMGTISTEGLRLALNGIIEKFFYARVYENNHSNQIRANGAKKEMEPALIALRSLRDCLTEIGNERWRDWAWIASNAYAESDEVKSALSERNAEILESIKGAEEVADHIVGPIDLVYADIAALDEIVNRVEGRWQLVSDALVSGFIEMPSAAFRNFIADLAGEWRRYFGQEPPAPTSYKDKYGNDKGGPFVEFVRSVLAACEIEAIPDKLGYDVANALTANAKSSKMGL